VPGIQVIPGNFLDLDASFVVADQADNEKGEMIYALTLLAPAEPVSGDGVVVAFDVRALNTGTSQMSLSAILSNRNGESLPVTVEGGVVVVGSDTPQPTLTSQSPPSPTPVTSAGTPTPEGISVTGTAVVEATGPTRSPRTTRTASPELVTESAVVALLTETLSPGESLSGTPEGEPETGDVSVELPVPESPASTEGTNSEAMEGIGQGATSINPGERAEADSTSDKGDNSLLVGGLVLLVFIVAAVVLFFGRRLLRRNQ
jgi:hypothetical protein